VHPPDLGKIRLIASCAKRGARRKIEAVNFSGRRSCRRARHELFTASGLAHWSQVSGNFAAEPANRRASQDSKGVSELHPVPFRNSGEHGEAFFPCGKGRVRRLRISASRRPFWQRQPLDQQAYGEPSAGAFSAKSVPKKCSGNWSISQAKTACGKAYICLFFIGLCGGREERLGFRAGCNFKARFQRHRPLQKKGGYHENPIRCAWALRCSGSGWIRRLAGGAGWRTDRLSFRK
jgi:hypothetical protein